jgi:hypothetical protein
MPPFAQFDFNRFWAQSDYAASQYVEAAPDAALIAEVETALGYRLPAAYRVLAAHQNGGIPVPCLHRCHEPTTWADDHVAIAGILAIGNSRAHSLCGEFGSRFWIDHWQYPDIGVYFADCPSAGHDMLCLDYRACGPAGQPSVVHVDQERAFKVSFVAPDFESFIRGLQTEESFRNGAA